MFAIASPTSVRWDVEEAKQRVILASIIFRLWPLLSQLQAGERAKRAILHTAVVIRRPWFDAYRGIDGLWY